jgi:hypothetical protein
MKHLTKSILTGIVAAGGLASTVSTHAQPVTGHPFLDNILPSAEYANWSGATFTSVSDGLNVTWAGGYGSGYFGIAAGQLQTLNANDNTATLTLTVNNTVAPPGNPSSGYWLGVPFIINDNAGAITYGGYAGQFGYTGGGTATWNGNTVTETVPLDPTQIAAIQAGNDTVYGFNLQLDPAVWPGGPADITFNSLVLSAVPEPATLTLLALGAGGILLARRRCKVS